VAACFAQLRDLDPPDFSGEEMRSLAIGGWKHVMHMADREVFKASIASDLAALEENPFPPAGDIPPIPRPEPPAPEHRSEFGL